MLPLSPERTDDVPSPLVELRPADHGVLTAFLRADVDPNLYLLGVLHRSRQPGTCLSEDGRFFAAMGAQRQAAPLAILYWSHRGLLVPAAGSDLDALQRLTWHHRHLAPKRIVVGPRPAATVVLDTLGATLPVRIDFPQHLFGLSSDGLILARGGDPAVELARPTDLTELCALLAAMQSEELGLPANSFETPGFRERVAGLIALERVFIRRVGNEIVFHASANALSPYGTQLEAVYTRPDQRGRGVATRALATVCERLFRSVPRIVLGVSDHNVPAIALYERLGFRATQPLRLASV